MPPVGNVPDTSRMRARTMLWPPDIRSTGVATLTCGSTYSLESGERHGELQASGRRIAAGAGPFERRDHAAVQADAGVGIARRAEVLVVRVNVRAERPHFLVRVERVRRSAGRPRRPSHRRRHRCRRCPSPSLSPQPTLDETTPAMPKPIKDATTSHRMPENFIISVSYDFVRAHYIRMFLAVSNVLKTLASCPLGHCLRPRGARFWARPPPA